LGWVAEMGFRVSCDRYGLAEQSLDAPYVQVGCFRGLRLGPEAVWWPRFVHGGLSAPGVLWQGRKAQGTGIDPAPTCPERGILSPGDAGLAPVA
jgi:hypothetical protein